MFFNVILCFVLLAEVTELFSVVAPKLGNSLHFITKCADTTDHFKSLLKTHLFSLAFPPP